MIKSFKGKCAYDIYHGYNTKTTRAFPSQLIRVAGEKLDIIEAAEQLTDLRVPPGNRLEALKGDLKGKHSIRINKQWRIVFRWSNGDAEDVEIIDYH